MLNNNKLKIKISIKNKKPFLIPNLLKTDNETVSYDLDTNNSDYLFDFDEITNSIIINILVQLFGKNNVGELIINNLLNITYYNNDNINDATLLNHLNTIDLSFYIKENDELYTVNDDLSINNEKDILDKEDAIINHKKILDCNFKIFQPSNFDFSFNSYNFYNLLNKIIIKNNIDNIIFNSKKEIKIVLSLDSIINENNYFEPYTFYISNFVYYIDNVMDINQLKIEASNICYYTGSQVHLKYNSDITLYYLQSFSLFMNSLGLTRMLTREIENKFAMVNKQTTTAYDWLLENKDSVLYKIISEKIINAINYIFNKTNLKISRMITDYYLKEITAQNMVIYKNIFTTVFIDFIIIPEIENKTSFKELYKKYKISENVLSKILLKNIN